MKKIIEQLFFGEDKTTLEFERSFEQGENGFRLEKYYRTDKGRWFKEVAFKTLETIEEHIETLRDEDMINLFLSENNTEFIDKYFPARSGQGTHRVLTINFTL